MAMSYNPTCTTEYYLLTYLLVMSDTMGKHSLLYANMPINANPASQACQGSSQRPDTYPRIGEFYSLAHICLSLLCSLRTYAMVCLGAYFEQHQVDVSELGQTATTYHYLTKAYALCFV